MHNLTKQTRRCLALGSLLGWAGLAGCTPVSTANLGWVVTNETAADLRVTVQYPLDSTLLDTPDQLACARQNQRQDSIAYKSFPANPLRWLCHHPPCWHFVYSRPNGIQRYQYTPAGTLSGYAQVDRAHGRLTYTLPPHRTQQLLSTGYNDHDDNLADYASRMTSLQLQQGATHQQVLPGRPLADVFQAERTGREHGNNSLHRVTLRVGPGLTLNAPRLRHWWSFD